MTYLNLLMEACGGMLPLLLLLPEESLGQLFQMAVSYMANDPDPLPLPPELAAAWEVLQGALDADVAACASPRTVFHVLCQKRRWYLRALSPADAGRLAAGFILTVLGLQPEFGAGETVQQVQLRSHFERSQEALAGHIPERHFTAYRKIRTALDDLQKATLLDGDEKDYLTGCLFLMQLEEQGESTNGTPDIQDEDQLALLLAARWLLKGGSPGQLNLDACEEAAAAYFAGPAEGETADPAPSAAPAEPLPEPADTSLQDAALLEEPPAQPAMWEGAWAADALGSGSTSDWD